MTNSDTRCVACKEKIAAGASICPTCKSYQWRWKNQLQYFSTIATLVVLILSGSAWLAGKIHKAFFSRDNIQIIEGSTIGPVVIVNRGDDEVYVSNILLWMAGRTSAWVAPQLVINEKLEPGQFLKRDWDSKLKQTASFARGLSQNDFEKLMQRVAAEDPYGPGVGPRLSFCKSICIPALMNGG